MVGSIPLLCFLSPQARLPHCIYHLLVRWTLRGKFPSKTVSSSNLTLSLTSYVVLGKPLRGSESQFPHLKNGVIRRLNEMTHIKYLTQSLANSKSKFSLFSASSLGRLIPAYIQGLGAQHREEAHIESVGPWPQTRRWRNNRASPPFHRLQWRSWVVPTGLKCYLLGSQAHHTHLSVSTWAILILPRCPGCMDSLSRRWAGDRLTAPLHPALNYVCVVSWK